MPQSQFLFLLIKHALIGFVLILAAFNRLVLLEELSQLEHLTIILKHDINLVDLAHDLLSLLRSQVLQNLLEALVREYYLLVLRVEHELAKDQLVSLLTVLEDAIEFLLDADELIARPMGHPLFEIGDLIGVLE